MNELRENTELNSITGPMGPDESSLCIRLGKNRSHYRSIVVKMQPGQMGMVPWARCEKNGGEVKMVNLAMMEDVDLLEDDNG